MMQNVPGTRTLALIAGLLLAATGSALAQDTTEMGGAPMDTSATAADTGTTDTTAADTSAVRDTTRDTTDTSEVQNPPGYRGMERDTTIFPPDSGNASKTPEDVERQTTGTYSDTSAQDTAGGVSHDTAGGHAAEDTAGADDSTSVGDTEPKVEDAETPRMHPSDSGTDSSGYAPERKE
jgi:hypothetical protein